MNDNRTRAARGRKDRPHLQRVPSVPAGGLRVESPYAGVINLLGMFSFCARCSRLPARRPARRRRIPIYPMLVPSRVIVSVAITIGAVRYRAPAEILLALLAAFAIDILTRTTFVSARAASSTNGDGVPRHAEELRLHIRFLHGYLVASGTPPDDVQQALIEVCEAPRWDHGVLGEPSVDGPLRVPDAPAGSGIRRPLVQPSPPAQRGPR